MNSEEKIAYADFCRVETVVKASLAVIRGGAPTHISLEKLTQAKTRLSEYIEKHTGKAISQYGEKLVILTQKLDLAERNLRSGLANQLLA